jgi:Protein of unknown function (DUF3102)
VDQIVTLGPPDNISHAVADQLAKHASEIRKIGGHAIVAIGERLLAAKKLVGHGAWGAWLEREFGWPDRKAQRFMAIAKAVASNPNASDLTHLNASFDVLCLLAAPSTPAEVVQGVVALGRKVTRKDVTRQAAVHQAARNPAPATPKSESMKALPVGDSAHVLAGKIFDAYAGDRKHRPLPKIAATFNVEPSVAREALIALGDCVVSRVTGGQKGQREFKIMRDSEANMLSAIAAKNEEIVQLKAHIAELENQIEKFTAPAKATAPSPAVVH